ncbi:MAG: hypothetical protein ACKV2U_30705 [Bryobacteraceae bacterium]
MNRAVEGFKKAKPDASIAVLRAAILTYHNDVISGSDRSFDLEFRTGLLAKDSATGSPPTYYQHTHGDAHNLYVATRNSGTESLAQYHLRAGDQLEIYRDEPAGLLNDAGIIDHPLNPDFIIKIEKQKLECVECAHIPLEPMNFWAVKPADPTKLTTTADMDLIDNKVVVGRIHRQSIASDTKILRRIVVRNASRVRYYIPLESGCSAFKICVASPSCKDEPLCKLDPAELFSSKACDRCGVTPKPGAEPRPGGK